jgi:hypothetical protein
MRSGLSCMASGGHTIIHPHVHITHNSTELLLGLSALVFINLLEVVLPHNTQHQHGPPACTLRTTLISLWQPFW